MTQEDTAKTIENAVFEALIKTKLIKSRAECNYHRCGRTDKGVSAFSQVISLDLRSNSSTGKGVRIVEGSQVDGNKPEVNFCKILNKSLPPEIKFYAWADVDFDFSARFDCNRRIYRYFLPVGNLDLSAMRDAANRLVGLHDFRNFSKLDRTKLENTFIRHIYSIRIEPLDHFITSTSHDSTLDSLYVLEVDGKAFLWHQIRCIVTILLLIGEGKEKPTLINDLLNIDLFPQKPQYALASELPLVLYDCCFERVSSQDWIYDSEAIADAVDHLQSQYVQYTTKSAIIACMLTDVKTKLCNFNSVPLQKYLLPSLKSANHQSIADRPVSQTQLNSIGELRVRNNLKHRLISKLIDHEQSDKKLKVEPNQH